jgi:drug/metabolite transporter (DMT)-like permease
MVLAVLFWGGSFIATKIAVAEVSPTVVVWSRFLIGMIFMLLPMWKGKLFAIEDKKEIIQYIYLGFLGITLHQWLQSSGLITSLASTTAWIVATTPLFMVILSRIFLKENLAAWAIVGILLCTVGVLLVVSGGDIASITSAGFGAPGDILIMISAPNWAIYSILLRDVLKEKSVIKTTFYSILFGWILTSIQFIYIKGWESFFQLSFNGWISILYLGIFCTYLAYFFYYDALQNLSAVKVGAFLYIEPVATMIIAAIILQEDITLFSLLGGGLILFGVWLVNQPKKV